MGTCFVGAINKVASALPRLLILLFAAPFVPNARTPNSIIHTRYVFVTASEHDRLMRTHTRASRRSARRNFHVAAIEARTTPAAIAHAAAAHCARMEPAKAAHCREVLPMFRLSEVGLFRRGVLLAAAS